MAGNFLCVLLVLCDSEGRLVEDLDALITAVGGAKGGDSVKSHVERFPISKLEPGGGFEDEGIFWCRQDEVKRRIEVNDSRIG